MQADSVEDVDKRLDGLAQSGRLDPAFMMTMSNAYANTKLTDATKEEVRDIMGYMYEQVQCLSVDLPSWDKCGCAVARQHVCCLLASGPALCLPAAAEAS